MTDIRIDQKRLRYWLTEPTDAIFAHYRRHVTTVGGQRTALLDRGGPILAVAHLDTVSELTRPVIVRDVCVATGLDDRLGAYIACDLLPRFGIKCDVLLTEDEERCASSGRTFLPEKSYNWMVAFDRAGTDTVLYQYQDNAVKWLKALVGAGLRLGMGSYNCIADMEHLGIKGLNVGIGYYENHTAHAFALLDETLAQVRAFAHFARIHAGTRFVHEPTGGHRRKGRRSSSLLSWAELREAEWSDDADDRWWNESYWPNEPYCKDKERMN